MTIRLITVALARYQNEPHWDVEAATASRRAVELAFKRHGLSVENWTRSATTTKVRTRLNQWIEDTDEPSILYWVGHGEHSRLGYRLALADSREPLTSTNALAGSHLFECLRDHVIRRGDEYRSNWTLVILDTCASSEGLWEIYRSFDAMPENLGIIATTNAGATFVGGFARDLKEELEGFTGNDTDGIPLRELARRFEDKGKMVAHRFSSSAKLPPRIDAPPPTQASLDVYAELEAVLATAPPELRNHFYAKAQGSEIGESAWYFSGRLAERRLLSEWLRDAPGGLRVVTGVAGSGKSALLGMLLASADDSITQALTDAGYAPVPTDARPVGVRFDAVVHLRGLTIGDAVRTLAESLDLPRVDGPDALLETLRQAADGSRVTVLVDALDEARDPLTLAALLRRLASAPGTRVLVGTRQSLHEDPDDPTPPDRDLLEVLAASPSDVIMLQRDPVAVEEYVNSRLHRDARFTDLGEDKFQNIASEIARHPQPFLFARLAVHEIIAMPELVFSKPQLTKLLAGGHRGIFGHAVRRFTEFEPEVEALLHALTYARGSGFPRTGGVWASAGHALASGRVTDQAVARALVVAAPYIMHDSEFGQGVYRLAHRTFVEFYLRGDKS